MSEELETQLPDEDVDKNSTIEEELAETSEENDEVAAEPAEPAPTPPGPKRESRRPSPSAREGYDYSSVTVTLSALVYHATQRRSISVLAVQNRLAELGYPSAKADLGGWLSNGTKDALDEYQQSIGAESWADAVRSLFDGTGATVVP